MTRFSQEPTGACSLEASLPPNSMIFRVSYVTLREAGMAMIEYIAVVHA
jgi:hypothetical protein